MQLILIVHDNSLFNTLLITIKNPNAQLLSYNRIIKHLYRRHFIFKCFDIISVFGAKLP